jgi:uncharacterized protein YutE (UPF0331/DUF86 family)
MIVQKRLRLYLESIYQEMKTIRGALQLPDDEIVASPLTLRGVKYSVVVIAEAIAGICQHILAKEHRIAVSGFGEALAQASAEGIIDQDLNRRLAPFLKFRNMLVHGYWKVDDSLFLDNLRRGIEDFAELADAVEKKFLPEQAPDGLSG